MFCHWRDIACVENNTPSHFWLIWDGNSSVKTGKLLLGDNKKKNMALFYQSRPLSRLDRRSCCRDHLPCNKSSQKSPVTIKEHAVFLFPFKASRFLPVNAEPCWHFRHEDSGKYPCCYQAGVSTPSSPSFLPPAPRWLKQVTIKAHSVSLRHPHSPWKANEPMTLERGFCAISFLSFGLMAFVC